MLKTIGIVLFIALIIYYTIITQKNPVYNIFQMETPMDRKAQEEAQEQLKKEEEQKAQSELAEKDRPERCRLNQLRFEETGPDGEFSMFLEQSYEKVRYVVHDPSGEDRQYYVSSQVLFDLYRCILDEDMENWKFLDSKDVEAETDTTVKVTYRIEGMTKDFGSRRMPAGGLEKLNKLVAIAAGYEDDDAETKPFTVTIKGKEYKTVRGTGNSVGMGAVIDFGDDKWWLVEEFDGHYELTDKARAVMDKENSGIGGTYKTATLDILDDGSFILKVDDDDPIETTVSDKRCYGTYASAMGGEANFDFYYDKEKDRETNILRVVVRGIPAPVNWPGYDIYLEKK